MPDFRKMTVQGLRDLARELLGPGHSRATKAELLRALEEARVRPPPKQRPAVAEGKAGSRGDARGKGTRATRAVAGGAAGAPGPRAAGVRAGKGAVAGGAPGPARARKPGKEVTAAAASAALGAVRGAASAARRKAAGRERPAGQAAGEAAGHGGAGTPRPAAEGVTDPEGFFVARVRGEEAVREAPHPLGEAAADTGARPDEGVRAATAPYQERLGELPWGYSDDSFVALPRDPGSIFLYWDHAGETLRGGFDGLDHPRVQFWIFARAGAGWERVRTVDFALEARSYYLHDLEPGRAYRVEIHVVDRGGRDRVLSRGSNEVTLPTVGPSPVVDDRFLRLPWDAPLGGPLGPGHPGAPFPDEARAALAQLSGWSHLQAGPAWGGSAGLGGIGAGGRSGRPSSPLAEVTPPTSPVRPSGRGGG